MVESQIASFQQVHYQIQILLVVESIMNIYDEVALDLAHELQLFHDRFDALLVHHSGLQHFFHGVHLAVFFNAPYFAEAASADGVVELEVGLRDHVSGFFSVWISLGAEILASASVTHFCFLFIFSEIIL